VLRVSRLLKPRETAATVFDVDYKALSANGKRALLFDLDNTLRRRWAPRLFPGAKELLRRLEQEGFAVGILTNRKRIGRDRLLYSLAKQMTVVHHAGKPRRKGFLELLGKLGASVEDAAMVGDRRLTDVLGGNRLGIHTVRVTHPQLSRGDDSKESHGEERAGE
jgi:HAD superfamily phosphatase (TIGR01668 family)